MVDQGGPGWEKVVKPGLARGSLSHSVSIALLEPSSDPSVYLQLWWVGGCVWRSLVFGTPAVDCVGKPGAVSAAPGDSEMTFEGAERGGGRGGAALRVFACTGVWGHLGEGGLELGVWVRVAGPLGL